MTLGGGNDNIGQKKKLKLRIRLNLTRYVEMWNMIKSFESQSQPCQLPWPSQGRGKIKNEDVLKVQINNNIIHGNYCQEFEQSQKKIPRPIKGGGEKNEPIKKEGRGELP